MQLCRHRSVLPSQEQFKAQVSEQVFLWPEEAGNLRQKQLEQLLQLSTPEHGVRYLDRCYEYAVQKKKTV